ncbi:hypothetical protein P2318_00020 [Myxococcaceae bacterium GXIMD 01537]
MTHRATASRSLLLTSALALAACGGEGASLKFTVDESTASAQSLAAQAVSPASEPALITFKSSDGVAFTLSEARIHLRDIRLDLPKGTKCSQVLNLTSGAECKGGDSGSGSGTLVVPGPLVVDLMTGRSTPDLSALRIPSGNYKRIDFRLEEAKSSEVPVGEPLVGYSLLARARFDRAGTASTLEMKLKFSEDARFESATGVDVPEGGSLLPMLRPAVWLEGLPLGACMQKGDVEIAGDVVRIDDRAKGDCGGAEDTVKRNIKRSGDLRKHD